MSLIGSNFFCMYSNLFPSNILCWIVVFVCDLNKRVLNFESMIDISTFYKPRKVWNWNTNTSSTNYFQIQIVFQNDFTQNRKMNHPHDLILSTSLQFNRIMLTFFFDLSSLPRSIYVFEIFATKWTFISKPVKKYVIKLQQNPHLATFRFYDARWPFISAKKCHTYVQKTTHHCSISSKDSILPSPSSFTTSISYYTQTTCEGKTHTELETLPKPHIHCNVHRICINSIFT